MLIKFKKYQRKTNSYLNNFACIKREYMLMLFGLIIVIIAFIIVRRINANYVDLDLLDVYKYHFASHESGINHYKKHKKELGINSFEDYIIGANNVITDPNSLKKKQTKDGDSDTVYLNPKTCEFVVVSDKRIIRTYFKPNNCLEYFNRQ